MGGIISAEITSTVRIIISFSERHVHPCIYTIHPDWPLSGSSWFPGSPLDAIILEHGRYPGVYIRRKRDVKDVLSFEWVWDSARAGYMLGPERYEIM